MTTDKQLSAERLDELERQAKVMLDRGRTSDGVCEVYDFELLTLISMARASVWRDISEAPKDGAWVLIASADHDTNDGMGGTGFWFIAMARFDQDMGWRDSDFDVYNPTHWMPVFQPPEPPE